MFEFDGHDFGDVPVTRWGPSYWGNYSVALLRKIEFSKYYPSKCFKIKIISFVNILADSKNCEKSPVTGPRRVGAETEGQSHSQHKNFLACLRKFLQQLNFNETKSHRVVLLQPRRQCMAKCRTKTLTHALPWSAGNYFWP